MYLTEWPLLKVALPCHEISWVSAYFWFSGQILGPTLENSMKFHDRVDLLSSYRHFFCEKKIINRKNIILMIIAIEIMLLAVTLLVLISSFSFDDGLGQTFSIFIISIAGAESVIGLSILVAFYRLRGSISLRT